MALSTSPPAVRSRELASIRAMHAGVGILNPSIKNSVASNIETIPKQIQT